MNLLSIEHLSKSYSRRQLFDDTSFFLQEGEKVGIIGINGTGKSTLLKIMAGLEETDEGTVTKANHAVIAYLPQHPVFDPEMTALDCVLAGHRELSGPESGQAEKRDHQDEAALVTKAKTMLTKLGVSNFDQKSGELSGGQRKRLALVSVLLKEADILLLDEPTNHLDHEMADWLEEQLKQRKEALVMITHDRYFLDSVCNRIAEVDKGKLYSYDTNYAGYLELKAQREEMAQATELKRQNILRTELAWVQRGARARSTKQKARLERYEELKNRKAPETDGQVELGSISTRLGRTTLEARHVEKGYGDRILIHDFSYIFLKNDRVAFIGANGCGKTTLMKLLTGKEQPDSGEIIVGQTVKIGYYAQEVTHMDPNMRVIDYVREVAEFVPTTEGSVSAAKMLERFLFEGSEQYTEIGRLSGGEKRRLNLLRVLMGAPNVLILDEPTNDLDITTLTVLEDYLDHFEGIVIIVSHDRYFLDRIASKIIEIDNTKVTVFSGNYSDYAAKKEQLRQAQRNAYLNQQAEIKHQEEVITKLKSFNREKSIKRAESREKMLAKIEVLDKPTEVRSDMHLQLTPRIESGNDVLTVEHLAKTFDRNTLFSDLSFALKRGEHVAIIGDNGTGKTTILKLINELVEPDAGTIRLGSKVQIGYYDQEHHVLHPDKTLFEEISDEYPSLNNTEIRNTLAAFLFTGDDVFKRIKDLSGGERGRVSLAKLMLSESNFLILDEPTNHLDIASKEILEDALNSYNGTVLYVSHDRYFINRTAHRILELSGGTLHQYLGNYDYYLEKKSQQDASTESAAFGTLATSAVSAASTESSASKLSWQAQKEKEAQRRKKENALKKCEEQIASLEERDKQIDLEMSDPKIATDVAALQKLSREKDEIADKLMELMEEWEQLSE